MDELEQLRRFAAAITEKFEKSNTPEAADMMDKATQAFKAIAEVEQSRAEARKLALEESKLRYDLDHAPRRDRSEQTKAYISLPPLLKAITKWDLHLGKTVLIFLESKMKASLGVWLAGAIFGLCDVHVSANVQARLHLVSEAPGPPSKKQRECENCADDRQPSKRLFTCR